MGNAPLDEAGVLEVAMPYPEEVMASMRHGVLWSASGRSRASWCSG